MNPQRESRSISAPRWAVVLIVTILVLFAAAALCAVVLGLISLADHV